MREGTRERGRERKGEREKEKVGGVVCVSGPNACVCVCGGKGNGSVIVIMLMVTRTGKTPLRERGGRNKRNNKIKCRSRMRS